MPSAGDRKSRTPRVAAPSYHLYKLGGSALWPSGGVRNAASVPVSTVSIGALGERAQAIEPWADRYNLARLRVGLKGHTICQRLNNPLEDGA